MSGYISQGKKSAAISGDGGHHQAKRLVFRNFRFRFGGILRKMRF